MLSIVWISSSCTTHFISRAENKCCSCTSVEQTGIRQSTATKHFISSISYLLMSDRLTCRGSAPGAVLTVLTLPTVLRGNPLGATDGMLVFRAELDVHRLLGNGVLNTKRSEVFCMSIKKQSLTLYELEINLLKLRNSQLC